MNAALLRNVVRHVCDMCVVNLTEFQFPFTGTRIQMRPNAGHVSTVNTVHNTVRTYIRVHNNTGSRILTRHLCYANTGNSAA